HQAATPVRPPATVRSVAASDRRQPRNRLEPGAPGSRGDRSRRGGSVGRRARRVRRNGRGARPPHAGAPRPARLAPPPRLLAGRDGAKRLLGRYTTASWSPHGLFEVAVHGHELAALDPKGNVRWSLERDGVVRDPRWSPDGYRIAYRAGSSLRVVAGDGTGDHLLARDIAPVAPAWRPGGDHVLAYVTPAGARSEERRVGKGAKDR